MNTSIRVFKLLLDTVTTRHHLDIAGHFVQIRRASSATANITLFTERDSSLGFPLVRGEGFKHFAFTRLRIDWAAQAGQWVELVVSGNPKDADPRLFEVFQSTNLTDVDISAASIATAVPVSQREFDLSDSTYKFDLNLSGSTVNTSYAIIYSGLLTKVTHIRSASLYSEGASTSAELLVKIGNLWSGQWTCNGNQPLLIGPFKGGLGAGLNMQILLKTNNASFTAHCNLDGYETNS